MDVGQVLGRGISFPPRIGPDGRVAWSAGDENVRDSIRVILSTEQNERLLAPDFGGGLKPYLFEPNTVATRQLIAERITRALEKWEPRITVESVTVAEDPADPRAAVATVTYALVATQTRQAIGVRVALGS
jgi:uncharacterized protein